MVLTVLPSILLITSYNICHFCSVFFSDKVASDRGGAEVLPETLRMPNNADYESFRKVIGQVRNVILSAEL